MNSNFFYAIIDNFFMFSQKKNEFVDEIVKWAESIGINLDRDPEQV